MNNNDKNEMMSQEMVALTLAGAISSRNLWHHLLPGASSSFCPGAPLHSWQHRNRISGQGFAPRKASGQHFARHHSIYFIFSFLSFFSFSTIPGAPSASKCARQTARARAASEPASRPTSRQVGWWDLLGR